VVGLGTRTKKKKGNCIRFVVAKNFICGWIWHENKKKRKETASVLSCPRIHFAFRFGTRTRKKKRNRIRSVMPQEFILRLDLAREHEKKKRNRIRSVMPQELICNWDLAREQKKEIATQAFSMTR